MKKLIEYAKNNGKVLILIILIFILTATVVILNNKQDKTVTISAAASGKTETEQKLTEILSSIAGVGDTDVMIRETDGEIEGVVIVCKGANNIMTRSDILNAVSTALNISKNIIAIYAMN